MDTNLKTLIIEKHEAVVAFFMGLETLLVFAVGLGRYRTVLVFGFFFLLRALLRWAARKERFLLILMLPALLTSIYYDFTRGQIFPVFQFGNALITIASLMIADALFVRLFLNRVLQKWSSQALFKVCPICKFDNKSLVNRCACCSYYKADIVESYTAEDRLIDVPHMPNDLINEIEEYKRAGFNKQPSKKTIKLVGLNFDEYILLNMRFFASPSFFIDGVRTVADNFLLTTQRVIFIHSLFFEKGWRMRETIIYKDITRLLITSRRVLNTDQPSLRIETQNGYYEIGFQAITDYREKIDNIILCIRRRRPDVRIESDMNVQSL